VHEVLAALEPRAPRSPVGNKDASRGLRVAYHDACHLGHAQKDRAEPRAVLRSIPELDLVDIPEAELCCGSAGIYNMIMPEAADDLGKRKADNVRSVRPDVIVTANPGCLLQIGKHLTSGSGEGSLPLLHPVQLLDASIRNVPVPRT
jgi:glycolate oxidase iron-sulfur subunit